MAGHGFDDHLRERLQAAALAPEHVDDFHRLARSLIHGPDFQLYLAEFGDSGYRDRIVEQLGKVLAPTELASTRVRLSGCADVPALEGALIDAAQRAQVIHLVDGETWFDGPRWAAWNLRREAIARGIRAKLVLWLRPAQVGRLPEVAADWWAWRAGIVDFVKRGTATAVAPFAEFPELPSMSMADRARRIAVLRQWLAIEPPIDAEARAPLAVELAMLLSGLGEVDEALRLLREDAVPVYERRGDLRNLAITRTYLADILKNRGQSDEALRIYESEVPTYEELDDSRGLAVLYTNMAGVLRERGQFHRAHELLREKSLVIAQRIGDVGLEALAWDRIADLLGSEGKSDESWRIRRDRVLPIVDQLGDVRGRATTLGKIAEAMASLGQLQEALQILRDDVLPTFERLGLVRDRTVTMGLAALILSQQGDIDGAIATLRDQVLPTIVGIGDRREEVIIRATLATMLATRNGVGDRAEAARLLEVAYPTAKAHGYPETKDIAAQLKAARHVPELRPARKPKKHRRR